MTTTSAPTSAAPARVHKRKVRQLQQSEGSFHRQVVMAARLEGWLVFHPWMSIHSESGWPDLFLVRPPRAVAAELKRDGREPTPVQQRWLEALGASGIEVYCWHPLDWPRVIEVLR